MVMSLIQVTEIGFVQADEHVYKWTDAVGYGWFGGDRRMYLLPQALNGEGHILMLPFCALLKIDDTTPRL